MIAYRIATESDYQNINDFHNRIYKKTRTLDQFYWEFHNAPAGKSIYIIATDDEKVIGTQCVIPIFLSNSKGALISSGKSEDTLVDPTYRGQNVFYRMYELLFEACSKNGIKVIWGFTSATKAFKKMGFDIPFDHKQQLVVNKVLPSHKYLASLNVKNKVFDKVKILGLSVLSGTSWSFRTSPARFDGYIFSDDNVTDIGSLLESNLNINPDYFAIDQSSDFLKWRIYTNPNYLRVHTYSLRDPNGELKGVAYANSHQNGVTYIIQSLFAPDLPFEQRVAFIDSFTHSLFKTGSIMIRNWVFDHNPYNQSEIKEYQSARYTHLDRGVSLVWKLMDGFKLDPSGFMLSRLATQGTI